MIELITALSAIIVALIAYIIHPWVLSKLKKDINEEGILPNTEIGRAIDHSVHTEGLIKKVLEELKCDRIWIAQFHNGGHYYPSHKSIQKFSIFHEYVNPEVGYIGDKIKDIPISLFPKFLCQLYRDGEILIPDTNIINGDDECGEGYWGTLSFLTGEEDKSFYMFLIEDLSGDFIGILGIEYIKEKYTLSEGDLDYINSRLGALGSLMTRFLNRV